MFISNQKERCLSLVHNIRGTFLRNYCDKDLLINNW